MKNLHTHHSHGGTFTAVGQRRFLRRQRWPVQSPDCLTSLLRASLCSERFSCRVSGKSVGSFFLVWPKEPHVTTPKSTVLPPPRRVLNPNTQMTSGVVLHILARFPQISVSGTVAFPQWRTSVTIFLWSSLVFMNNQIVSVSFMMVPHLQGTREEKS